MTVECDDEWNIQTLRNGQAGRAACAEVRVYYVWIMQLKIFLELAEPSQFSE